MISKRIGLIVTLLTALLITYTFYADPIRNLNDTFFAADGDGLKDYFGTYYYVEHDTALLHSEGMNYPHGEHVFFTGNQPSISLVMRFINNNITPVSHWTVGVVNLFMLASITLGALFLYLLLVHFKLPVWYSILVSIGITFLSPQLARMPGHFSLSYIFAIPAMLYLVARFHERPRIIISVIMGLFVLWALGTHIYMLGFHASIILLYWIYAFIFFKGTFKNKKNWLHLGLQFILPLFIFITVVFLSEHVTDRTSYPWGFFNYKALPESIFLPLGKPYASFLYKLTSFSYVPWESIAYIGLVALVGFITLVVIFFRNLFTRRFLLNLNPTDNIILNIFFWSSLLMLFYSFGLPFIISGLKPFVHFLGPLKQMRGIARFSWLFFYVINILVFYYIWQLRSRKISKTLWTVLLIGSLSMLGYDAWLNVRAWSPYVNNSIPLLSDRNNESEENQWVNNIDFSRFQATIPIPYFHIGSENFWELEHCGIGRHTMVVSWKTGLPSMGVMLSRTSRIQTIQNLELFREPYRRPAIVNELDPTRSFLLISANDCPNISQHQLQLLNKATLLHQALGFSLYELPFDSLVATTNNVYPQIVSQHQETPLFPHGEYMSTNPQPDFKVSTFGEPPTDAYYFIPGSQSDRLRKGDFMYVKDLPTPDPNQEYIFSVWINDLQEDLLMRSRLFIQTMDDKHWGVDESSAELFYGAVAFDGNWVLVERKITLHENVNYLRFKISNNDTWKSSYTVNHLMIRPANTDIYRSGDGWLMKNNRFYIP